MTDIFYLTIHPSFLKVEIRRGKSMMHYMNNDTSGNIQSFRFTNSKAYATVTTYYDTHE
jgi:hypothetical protein